MFLIFPYQYPLLEAILAALKTWWKLIREPHYSTHSPPPIKKKKKISLSLLQMSKSLWLESRAAFKLSDLVHWIFCFFSYWEINLWNCMWLKSFKMIQNRMGKGARARKKQEKGGGNPNNTPPQVIWLHYFNFGFFLAFYKTHNSVCRFSAVYKENMRYADA